MSMTVYCGRLPGYGPIGQNRVRPRIRLGMGSLSSRGTCRAEYCSLLSCCFWFQALCSWSSTTLATTARLKDGSKHKHSFDHARVAETQGKSWACMYRCHSMTASAAFQIIVSVLTGYCDPGLGGGTGSWDTSDRFSVQVTCLRRSALFSTCSLWFSTLIHWPYWRMVYLNSMP